jgi:hypothetical protein
VPYHALHVARGLFLDVGQQVIGVVGVRGLGMPDGLGGGDDTSQEQEVLAVLRRSKILKGPNPAATCG